MSPTQYTPKTEPNNGLYDSTPPQLKINKDSYFIRKSSSPPPPSSSSSSLIGNLTATPTKPQPRQPVIIYTHSPKIIHTHPRDFMALVQKLTGYTRSDDHDPAPNPNGKNSSSSSQGKNDHKGTTNRCVNNNDQDNESTNSVITDENGSYMGGDPQVNSCFVPPPMFDPCFNNIPFFTPISNADFLCSTATTTSTNSSLYNFADSLFLMPNNIRSSMSSSSSSSLEGMKNFQDI